MKHRLVICAAILIVSGFGCRTAGAGQTRPSRPPIARQRVSPLEGTWAGTLEAGDAVLHLVVHLSMGEHGSLKAALDSLDQGVYGIEASSISHNQSELKLAVKSVNASYQGKISADEKTIAGTWSQGGATLPLVFHRQDRAAAVSKPSDPVASAEGVWQGALETKGMRFRLQLHVSHDAQRQLVAAMDSIDQGINGVSATKVAQTEAAVHFELPAVDAIYDGTLNAGNNTLTGHWKQGENWEPLNFKRSDRILELRRPQTPVKPYPYREEEVVFSDAKASVSLSGTLTVPRGAGPFPGAILLAGSGPLDRDESDSGHQPFLVLADYLTRQGIAVLRYDKRGIGKSTGNYGEAITQDFAEDAEAALAFLKNRKEMDAKRIGLIGHSEGGVIAPMIAARSSDIAWIVILAGPATKGEETLLLQSRLIDTAAGMNETQIAKSVDFDRQVYTLVRTENDRVQLDNKLSALIKKSGLGPETPPAIIQRQVEWTSSPWFRHFLDYDPSPALQKTKCPVLVLVGEKDLQVPPSENLPLFRKALEAGGNRDFQVIEMPDLNHLFQHCLTGLPAESRAIEETFSADAMKTILDWVARHNSF